MRSLLNKFLTIFKQKDEKKKVKTKILSVQTNWYQKKLRTNSYKKNNLKDPWCFFAKNIKLQHTKIIRVT